jgi:hypothetical protein
MFKRLTQGFAAISAFVLLTGFGSGAPVYNVVSSPIPQSPDATMPNIQKAIMRAGLTLGWQVVPKAPGNLEAVLILRTHRAVVDITHDTRTFSITYKDSTNISYDEQRKTVHSNYNGWVQNLEKGIRIQVQTL